MSDVFPHNDLPDGWGRRRLKTVAELRTSNVDKNKVEGERPIRLCNYTDVYYSNRIADSDGLMEATATEEEIRRFRLRRGDVLVTKDSETADDIAVPAFVARDFDDVLCGYHLAILRPRNGLDGRYLYYALLTDRVGDQFAIGANGITRFGLSQSVLKDAVVPLPPFPTQRAIADFLDRETAKIDTLIDKKQRLLELLDEKRTALITRAVTRGLDPDVPMKDSGVEWIGEIPENWDLRKLGYAGTWYSGSTPNTNESAFWQGQIPWVSAKDMGPLVISGSEDHVTDEAVSSGRTRLLHPGSLVLVVRGMILARAFPVAVTAASVTFNQDLKGIVPKRDVVPRFLLYRLKASEPYILGQVERAGHGTTKLRTEILKNLPIPMPARPEQQQIVDELDATMDKLDEMSDRVAAAMTLLQEYRAALISAAVAGKIDVRNRVPD